MPNRTANRQVRFAAAGGGAPEMTLGARRARRSRAPGLSAPIFAYRRTSRPTSQFSLKLFRETPIHLMRPTSNREKKMTTNAVSGANPAVSLSSLLGATRSLAGKADNDGDSDSGGGVQGGGNQGGGSTLYTALLSALTQFVTSHSAGTAAGTGTSGTTGTPTTPATTTTTPTSAASSGAAPSTLPQDLHAFLHDLFRALRQEG